MIRRKKWILLAAVLLCLLFSCYNSVVRFSATNLENILEKRENTVFQSEDIQAWGWSVTEFGYVSSDEPCSISVSMANPVYVRNLLVDGSFNMQLSEVTVRFTSVVGGSDYQTKTVPVEIKNSNFYIEIDETVAELYLDLCSEAGYELELSGISLNPRTLNVDVQSALLSFLFPFSVILFLVEFLCDRDGFMKTFSSLKHFKCLLVDLVSRDIKTKYRRSVLGILWSVLNPLLMMLVLTAVFANIFRYQIDDFPVYYLTGYILFNFVSEATSFSMTSIINASGLIKKVYLPKIIFPLEKCLFSLVNLLFSLIAAVIVFLIVGVDPSWTMLLFFVPILYLFIFNFGFSLILATMNTFFRDVGYLYSVFITLWVYLTPIIYPISVLPAWMQSVVRLNPLTHFVEYFRAITLYGQLPSFGENLICIAYSLTFLLIGIVVFQRKQNKFIFYI